MLGYLINQYPAASQTFIRREIAAIEASGTPVRRYAVRGWSGTLVDPDDQAEHGRTARILDVGAAGVLVAALASNSAASASKAASSVAAAAGGVAAGFSAARIGVKIRLATQSATGIPKLNFTGGPYRMEG